MLVALPSAAESQLTRVSPDCDQWMGVNVLTQFNPDATACAGAFSGNDAQQVGSVLGEISAQGWGSMSYLGTTDAGYTNGPFSSVPGTSTGILVLNAPLTGNYVLSLKVANQFSLYYFAGLTNVTQIDYYTLGSAVNEKGVAQGLSHASLFGTPTRSVPEPGTVMLMLGGLLGLGAVRHRRATNA